MNIFTIDMAVKSENLNSNSILRLHKQNMMLKFVEKKSNEPRLTQKQICNQLGCSDSTIKRYRDDISMKSPYKRNKYRKKNNKPNTTITKSLSHTTNETPKNNEHTKSNEKNDLKCDSVIENIQEDNTKLYTLARKMVDNVKDSHSLNG